MENNEETLYHMHCGLKMTRISKSKLHCPSCDVIVIYRLIEGYVCSDCGSAVYSDSTNHACCHRCCKYSQVINPDGSVSMNYAKYPWLKSI